MEKFLLGVAVGALAVFMMDPQSGRRRRALVRDKVVHAGHVGRDYIEHTSRDLRNRAQGMVAELRSTVDRRLTTRDESVQAGASPTSM